MKSSARLLFFILSFCSATWALSPKAPTATLVHEPIGYEMDGTSFRGHLIYEATGHRDKPLPGIVMVPNWMGPDTPATLRKAKAIADSDFAVFVVDMYGVDVRPTDATEAGEAAGVVRGDRPLMRARAAKAVEVFEGLSSSHPIDPDKMLGIGFCFGGGTLLEFARGGSDALDAIVSFHGDLASPTLQKDASKITTPLLVLHGADDPYVPQSDVQAFIDALQSAGVDDWTLVQFSGTVHSFTDPTADSEGARYNRRTAERAFEMMEDFAREQLDLED
ncbi:MAG: dienelactone hydrolase family protein [Opitutales bacterium]